MRNKFKTIVAIMMISCMIALNVYAEQKVGYSYNPNDETLFLPSKISREIFEDVRGTWLSNGMLEISNPGGGEIGVYMVTQCHQPVDEIVMSLFVDQWDDDREDWRQVDYKQFSLSAEDLDEPLTDLTLSFNLTGHEKNQWYRLRGFHVVYKGDDSEMFSTRTDGIKITS